MKNSRFIVGLAGVALIVAYLVWSGISSSMVYYMTPSELVAKASEDPVYHTVGLKVSGRVVSGSYSQADQGLTHLFQIRDLEFPEVSFAVKYGGNLPDTFTEDIDVVLEGRFGEDRVFEADELLTKCGSRYEASPEELAGSETAG